MATYSYDDSHPTDKDKIRALIPDTDVSSASKRFLSDEQINLILTQNGSNLQLSLADALETVASILANDAETFSYGSTGVSGNTTQPPSFYLRRADRLRKTLRDDTVFFEENHLDYATDGIGNDISNYTGD